MKKKLILLAALFSFSLLAAEPKAVSFRDAKEMYVSSSEAKLFCRVMGKGDPLIVIHGGPGLSQDYLLPYMAKLAETNLVIFYDQRGCGKSLGEVDEKNVQIVDFIEDLDAIRKNLGFRKVSLLGHSWGGFIAMQYALSHPESVEKLVLLSSMAATSDEFSLFLKETNLRLAPLKETLGKFEQSPAFLSGDSEINDKYMQLIFATYCFNPQKAEEINVRMTPKANTYGFKIRKILSEITLAKPFNILNDLKKLSCQTLIIHGDKDPIPLSGPQNLHQHIKNSKLILLKECGHFPYVEKPQEFFKHLEEFLSN